MFLAEITNGSECKIVGVYLNDKMKKRLSELGVKKGAKVKVIKKSVKKAPMIFLVKNTFLSVREEDAKKIEVIK